MLVNQTPLASIAVTLANMLKKAEEYLKVWLTQLLATLTDQSSLCFDNFPFQFNECAKLVDGFKFGYWVLMVLN